MRLASVIVTLGGIALLMVAFKFHADAALFSEAMTIKNLCIGAGVALIHIGGFWSK